MFTCLLFLALFASTQGRAVNISNTWVLPEEGFPVFYRYFRDRISWYEADAVCQFHHANLVTVDTTAQYDAVRAYLKELDISSAVWVGLIRSNPDGDFTWTDYRGLSSDGYWSAAPDARAAPLCAAADPAADYRWEARACGGPTVASFICELPVPQWALGNEGCMVRAIPALTVLYLPESAAVQLTADCGLATVKRVQCTGNVKREDLLKELSCSNDEESSSTTVISTDGISNLSESSANSTDLEIVAAEDHVTTKHDNDETSVLTTEETLAPIMKEKSDTKQQMIINKLNKLYSQKNINLDLIHNNNLQSNDIPKLANNNENFLTVEQTEKLEDEKHMHHKMLHDELARHGNFETIFSQPSDHFVPPLVMAKAKLSDDMTVLSLAEKHAQQLAEKRLSKHNLLYEHDYRTTLIPPTEEARRSEIVLKPAGIALQPINKLDINKKENIKPVKSKKYKEKYEDPKSKAFKIDGKLQKMDKSGDNLFSDHTTKQIGSTVEAKATINEKQEEDTLELTVTLHEANETKKLNTTYQGIDNIQPVTENIITTDLKSSEVAPLSTPRYQNEDFTSTVSSKKLETHSDMSTNHNVPSSTSTETATLPLEKLQTAAMQDIALNHEVIKITIIKDDENNKSTTQTVFEVSTLMPKFKDDISNTDRPIDSKVTNTGYINVTSLLENTANSLPPTSTNIYNTTYVIPETTKAPISDNNKVDPVTEISSEIVITSTTTESHLTTSTESVPMSTTARTVVPELITESSTTADAINNDKADIVNITEIFDGGLIKNSSDPYEIDDLNSPLLSGASEPLHRPNRLRRPQQQNKLAKFNPFRILG